MFDFLRMAENYEDREIGRWDSEDGLQMISTAVVDDGHKPIETAVQHPDYNNGKMIIVECYDTKEEAQKGHKKWLKMVLENKLPSALIDCRNAKISQIIDMVGGEMAFERNTKVDTPDSQD